jgi:hypothetical protein
VRRAVAVVERGRRLGGDVDDGARMRGVTSA